MLTRLDSSLQSQIRRLQTQIITLQNFVGGLGTGIGCPAASTNWSRRLKELLREQT